jgi:hypothetical protein
MIKDIYLRLIFIPLLGVFIPWSSGIIDYKLYHVPGLIGVHLYFIIISFIIWTGSNRIHSKIRSRNPSLPNVFTRMFSICFASALYTFCLGGLSALAWIQYSGEIPGRNNILRYVLGWTMAAIFFTLIYEILFLNKERELDTKIVDQLDHERSQAELQALQSEMDPHFIFNALNTLNYLILNNPLQAHLYNNKLAQVYKYFLINRSRELIPLKSELEFMNDYFFLLQLRHNNKLQMDTRLNHEPDAKIMIPPCSLQILIENAIKHNEFSQTHPLHLSIAINGQHLNVSNNLKRKLYTVHSTGIGLKNLSSRYRIICHQDIIIEKTFENFIVKLPLIRQP